MFPTMREQRSQMLGTRVPGIGNPIPDRLGIHALQLRLMGIRAVRRQAES